MLFVNPQKPPQPQNNKIQFFFTFDSTMICYDVWCRITFYSNGKFRQNLSFLNHDFRKMITKHHIHLLKAERKRLFNFLIVDVKSTSVQRFVSDFEHLVKIWKPPSNQLLLHYVDYNYHMLYIAIFLLKHYEIIQLFLHFTNNLGLKGANIIIEMIDDFSCYSRLSVGRIVNKITTSPQVVELDDLSIFELHYKVFGTFEYIRVYGDVCVNYGDCQKLYKNEESFALRFFSLSDIIRRRYHDAFLPPDHHFSKILPQYQNLSPLITYSHTQLMMSPYTYQQLHTIITKECKEFNFENIITNLCKIDDPIASLNNLFVSQEYKQIKLLESPETITETMFPFLLREKDRKRLGNLYTNHLIFVISFKNNVSDYFCFWKRLIKLTDAQLLFIGDCLITLRQQKKQNIINFFQKLKHPLPKLNHLLDNLDDE